MRRLTSSVCYVFHGFSIRSDWLGMGTCMEGRIWSNGSLIFTDGGYEE